MVMDLQIGWYTMENYKKIQILENVLEIISVLDLNKMTQYNTRNFLFFLTDVTTNESLNMSTRKFLHTVLQKLPGCGMPEKTWEHGMMLNAAKTLPIFSEKKAPIPCIQNYLDSFIELKT